MGWSVGSTGAGMAAIPVGCVGTRRVSALAVPTWVVLGCCSASPGGGRTGRPSWWMKAAMAALTFALVAAAVACSA